MILAVCGVIATYWIFFYARPPALTLLENDVVFSLYGIKIKIPYSAISVSVVNKTRESGAGMSNIIRFSGVYPLKWVYWFIIFGGIGIFIAISLKEGYNFKVALALVGLMIILILFTYVINKLTYKLLSTRMRDISLNIFINKSHLNALNKWPFSYYKTRWFIYQLDLISFINKKDLLYIIKTFKEKLNENSLHKTVLEYEKQIA